MYTQHLSSVFPPIPIPVASPASAIDRAQHLCRAAEVVKDQASQGVTESRRKRSERTHWRGVWLEYCARADHLVICCAYCGRIRLRSGLWTTIPESLARVLRRSTQATLSHGFCEDCLSSHFP